MNGIHARLGGAVVPDAERPPQAFARLALETRSCAYGGQAGTMERTRFLARGPPELGLTMRVLAMDARRLRKNVSGRCTARPPVARDAP
jgi:hypothetical protein